MSNIVEILVTAKDLTGPAMGRVNARVNAAGDGMRAFHKTALLAGAGIAAIGVESVRMASKFDSSMTLLHTQAGVANSQMGTLKKGVLALAGKVGQDPDSLAESLFHVESNFESMGISSAKALKLTETAAKGATVGHADLVDVTNALTAAVAAGIPGVQNMDKAMGVLNATVGVGDMKMQDLAAAFGSGMVATVKGFGLSITDVGAALATFGDNNIRGSLAGNQLRMSVMALAKPVSTAHDALQKLGLGTDTLAKDMQRGGLKLALQDLVDRMHAAGISSKEQGQIITDAFGRKAGAGLNILVGQFDRLKSKYPALAEGANKFGDAWKDTQKTFAFQVKALQSGFDALMIGIGEKLIPPVQSFLNLLLQHKTVATDVAAAMGVMLVATVAISGAMKVAAAATAVYNLAGTGLTALKGVFETIALKAMYMRQAFVAAGGGIAGLRGAFASLGKVAKASVVIGGLALLAFAVSKIADLGKTAPPDIDKLTTSLKNMATSGKFGGELQKTFGDMDGLVAKVKKLNDETAKSKQTAFGFRIPGLDDLADKMANSISNMTKGKDSLDALKGDFNSLDQALAGMASNGFASAAAKDFDQMSAALKGAGYSTKDISALFPKYQDTLAGVKAEQKLTADSMGLFGDAAVSTQQKLDGESQAAKGLENSIMALNAVHRGAFDAETAFYQAMSDASKAVKENGKTLNIHTDAGRKNRDVLSQLAAKTEDYVDKLNKQHFSADKIDKTYQQGRKNLIDTAKAMGDTTAQATKLADELLKAPEAVKIQVGVDKKAAEADLNAFNAAVRHSPKSKSVTLKTLSQSAEAVLESFGFKVRRLPNGKVTITAKAGQALSAIGNVKAAVDSLHSKTIGIGVYKTEYLNTVHRGPSVPGVTPYAVGGPVTGGSGTHDDVPILAMGGEFMVRKGPAQKYHSLLKAINEDRLPKFAKGGSVTKAEQQARNDARGELSISHFGVMGGYKNDEFRSALGKGGDISSLIDALNQWRNVILKATHGGVEKGLLKALDRAGSSLLKYDKQLNAVNSALEKAKTKLSDLKSAAASLKDSVKSGLMGEANITKAAGASDSQVTINTLLGTMGASAANTKQFSKMLADLKKKGVSGDLIEQIASAGIEGGGMETAAALLGGSKADIKRINDYQKQIGKSAGDAGQTAADAMYAAGIKAAEGLVKGLEKKKKSIENTMMAIAKSMEKAIKKALGIRSPSKVMEEVGHFTAEGFSVGMKKNRSVQPAWASMLNVPRTARSSAHGMYGAQPVVLEIHSGGSKMDDLVVEIVRKSVRVKGGGNVQRHLGN